MGLLVLSINGGDVARNNPVHRVEQINFRSDYVLCTCGIDGTQEDFEIHKKIVLPQRVRLTQRESSSPWNHANTIGPRHDYDAHTKPRPDGKPLSDAERSRRYRAKMREELNAKRMEYRKAMEHKPKPSLYPLFDVGDKIA